MILFRTIIVVFHLAAGGAGVKSGSPSIFFSVTIV
jgi:hypothetical protein